MKNYNYTHGLIREFASDVEETRTVEFVISSNSKDRHGTVVNMDNWQLDNYNRNGIVGYQHNVYGGGICEAPDPNNVIGIGKAWKENNQLIGQVKFEPKDINPLADIIFKKVLFGSLKATSVGFKPVGTGSYGEGEEAKGRSNETYYFAGQELLEFSIVNIPSNPDAIKKSLEAQTENAIAFIQKTLNNRFDRNTIMEMRIADVIDLIDGKPTVKSMSISDYDAEIRQRQEVIERLQSEIEFAYRLKDYYKTKLSCYKNN